MTEEDEDPPGLNRLPRELLFDIFSRCPPKSLYRFRCVCSKWLSILTADPDFISFYHNHHRLSPLLLFSSRRSIPAATGDDSELVASCHRVDSGLLRFKFAIGFSGDLKLVLSCHGIVCYIFDSKVFLFDPATARTSNLSSSPNFKYTCSAAIGFSAIGAEFKLVHLYTYEKFDNHHYSKVKELVCEVLTVSTSALGFDSSSAPSECWRFLGKCPFNVLGRKSYVCANGFIYWLVAEKSYNPDCVRILSFDLVNEDFGVVSFPRIYSNRSAECLGLLEVGEKLCLTDRLPWETTMAVWELEDSIKNAWVKKFEIDLGRFNRNDMKILGHLPPISDGGGEVVIKLDKKDPLVYDLEKGTFREIHNELEDEEEEEEEEEEMHLELELLLNRKHLL